MPADQRSVKRPTPTADEWPPLLKERRKALDQVAADGGLEGHTDARHRFGYRAYLEPLRRDADGNLVALITVVAPHLTRPYVRRIRLVRRQPLRLV